MQPSEEARLTGVKFRWPESDSLDLVAVRIVEGAGAFKVSCTK